MTFQKGHVHSPRGPRHYPGLDGRTAKKFMFLLGVSPTELAQMAGTPANGVTRWRSEHMSIGSWKRVTQIPAIADLMERRGILPIYGGLSDRDIIDVASQRVFVDCKPYDLVKHELRTLDVGSNGCPEIKTVLFSSKRNLEFLVRSADWVSVLNRNCKETVSQQGAST